MSDPLSIPTSQPLPGKAEGKGADNGHLKQEEPIMLSARHCEHQWGYAFYLQY